jgi:hypothetical protein
MKYKWVADIGNIDVEFRVNNYLPSILKNEHIVNNIKSN